MKKIKYVVLGIGLITIAISFRPSDKLFEISKNLDILANLYKEVNEFYVDEVSPTELMNTAIHSMLNKLDPYTNYISADRIEDYRTLTTGEYGGIGVVIGKRNDKIVVVMPNQGYAADRAGIKIGDELIYVNGQNVQGKTIDDISKLLKGQSSSDIIIKVKRYGQDTPLEFTMQREKIHLKNVPYYGMVTDDIGMIQLTDFTRNASKEVKDALNDLKGKGAEKVILDLRGNPGGLLNEAINISNIFLPKGVDIVSTKGKIEDWNRTHRALNNPVDTEIPVAVLINGNSASASEIVSGVLQDYDRGVLVGRRSFGKGLVQATRPLSYNSQLKITVAKYYIPSGRCIQEIDYSHRDEDGIAEKIPDSLRVAFSTQNGRVVYDGGGVKPDIEIFKDEAAHITRSLISKGLVFNYATVFQYKNEEIAEAKDFELSDEEYDTFVAWLKGKDYDYKTQVEKSFDRLVASAKSDKYYDGIKEQIDDLEKKIYHNKESDLYKFKAEIKEALEREIATRYYLENGTIEATFDDDEDVITAVSLLNDTERYQQILSGK